MSGFFANFSFDFGELNNFYYKLLKEEDFDFKSKNISIYIEDARGSDNLDVAIEGSSVLDLKIANSALIKSIETIDKTLNI